MFLQHPLPLPSLSLCSSQRGRWKMIWYKQGISFLSHRSLPIYSVLTAQPITKAVTQIQFCLLHSTQGPQVLLLTETEVERDDQQARSFPVSIRILKSQKRIRRWRIFLFTAFLLCTVKLSQISIAHCAEAPGAGRKGNKRVMALLSFLWTHAQGMQQPHAHSWKQSAC